jgi:predicted nucleic acid-binding protein
MASSRRRDQLEAWLETVKLRFGERLLGFGEAEAETWGKMTGLADSIGRSLPVIDALIAATALENGHVVVTRNIKDFQQCGVDTLDPWQTRR